MSILYRLIVRTPFLLLYVFPFVNLKCLLVVEGDFLHYLWFITALPWILNIGYRVTHQAVVEMNTQIPLFTPARTAVAIAAFKWGYRRKRGGIDYMLVVALTAPCTPGRVVNHNRSIPSDQSPPPFLRLFCPAASLWRCGVTKNGIFRLFVPLPPPDPPIPLPISAPFHILINAHGSSFA